MMNKLYNMTNPSPSHDGTLSFMVSLSSEVKPFVYLSDLKIDGISRSHHGDYAGEWHLYVDNRHDANEVWLQLTEKLDRVSESLPELRRQRQAKEADNLEEKARGLLRHAEKLRGNEWCTYCNGTGYGGGIPCPCMNSSSD